ncbi:hypothetical protein M3J09_007510 [Ascochyta lentis]
MKKKNKIPKRRMVQEAPSEEPPPPPEESPLPEFEDKLDLEEVEFAEPAPNNEEILREPWTSLYVEVPVTLHFGPEETTFYVPRHYLPSQWAESGTAARFYFPDVDSRTSYAVVHYLYKQTYKIPAFQVKH